MICVDWSAGAADPNYVRAAVNTRLVGKQLAILIDGINRHFKTNINGNTHVIGFSLGAHVAGFAGDHLKNLSRITGTKHIFSAWCPLLQIRYSTCNVIVVYRKHEYMIILPINRP